MELIPSIDLRNGRAVRLLQGDFSAETSFRRSPAQLYRSFDAAGARRLHVVDLDRARGEHAGNFTVLRALCSLTGPRIQTGGGIRRLADVVRVLADGAERAVVGSVAVESPSIVADWVRRFGADHIVAALDVRVQQDGTPRLATHGWQVTSKLTLWERVEQLASFGIRHILCTDISRDGTLTGPNIALYRQCVRRFRKIAWQASGGIRDAADLRALAKTGVAAAISGRALLERRISSREMAPFLPAA
jgi:phosphoribosylformimino-5-aminoimidazole carboxamide ribotide isomerase